MNRRIQEIELMNIIAPYSNWEDDGTNNRKAKESLSA